MNPFIPSAPFLYPLKTENLTVCMLSEGRKLGTNVLININSYCTHFIRLAGWQLSAVATGWMKIFPGWELSWWEISGWEFSWVGVVRVGVFLGEICPGGTYQGWDFLWWKLFVWELSGGNHPGSNFHVTNFQIVSF